MQSAGKGRVTPWGKKPYFTTRSSPAAGQRQSFCRAQGEPPGWAALLRAACGIGRGPACRLAHCGHRDSYKRASYPGAGVAAPALPALAGTQQYAKAGRSATGRWRTGHTPSGPGSHGRAGGLDQRRVGKKSLELSEGPGGKPCPAWLECLQPRLALPGEPVKCRVQLHAAAGTRMEDDAFPHWGLRPPVGIFWFMLLPCPHEKWDLHLSDCTDAQGHRTHRMS